MSDDLHLTVIHLTDRASRLLDDAYVVHRALLAETGGIRPLWCAPDRRTVIVQHSTPITASAFPRRAVADIKSAKLGTAYSPSDVVRLSLIGCAVKIRTLQTPDGTRRGVAIITLPPEEQADWLTRKLAGAVDLHRIEVEQMLPSVGRKAGARITHTRVGFAASGTVVDPDVLAERIRNGVGKGRAFGLGLLLVAGARQ